MKRLIFLRHAKAERWDGQKNDFDRNLTERGENDSLIMADVLNAAGIKPNIVYSSSAERTIQTANIVSEKLGISQASIKQSDELYEDVTTADVLELISTMRESVHNLMIVGHNPWISTITEAMSADFDDILPTCGVAVLDFKVDFWDEVLPGSGKIKLYDFPKNHY